MRKIIGMALTLCVAGAGMPGFAVAQEEMPRRPMALSGTVVAGDTVTIKAPFGGELEDFSVRAGDIVAAGDTLFVIRTQKVYAPADGTVGSVGGQAGDDAAFLTAQYDAVMFVEPEGQFRISSDNKEAYAADANQLAHIGEAVYIGSRTSSERAGTGFISAVDGEKFTVEVTGGNLILDDSVAIYRSPDFTNQSKIGVGRTEKRAPIAISAEGSLYRVHVTQGQRVRRGELLLETISGSLSYNALPTNQVLAGHAAVVATVDATPGTTATQGQLLATLYPLSGLCVSAEVSESELGNIAIGDTVRVELTGGAGGLSMEGTVTAIGGLAAEGSGPSYPVTIALENPAAVRPGMTAQVYCNE